MITFLAAITALLAASSASAAPLAAKAVRGNLGTDFKIAGKVEPDDVFRIKSRIDGRIEEAVTSTSVWHKADEPLALIADRELAAMLETQTAESIAERWHGAFKPTALFCPEKCFVLKSFAKPKSWVKPQDVLFEAASALKLNMQVRPEDAPRIRDGLDYLVWSTKNPTNRLMGQISRFAASQGTFSITLPQSGPFEPGDDWEGVVHLWAKKDVIIVPTAALIVHGGDAFVPVRVAAGIEMTGRTEITGGLDENREILILDDSKLNAAAPAPAPSKKDVPRPAAEPKPRAKQKPKPAPKTKAITIETAPAAQPSHAEAPESPDSGEGPYGGGEP